MDRMSQLSMERKGSFSIDKSEVNISDCNQKAIICENGVWAFSGSTSFQIMHPKTIIKHEELVENKMMKFKKIPKNEAEKLILSHITKELDGRASEIIYDLDLAQLMLVLMMQRKSQ